MNEEEIELDGMELAVEEVMSNGDLFLNGILSQIEVLTNRFELLLLLYIFNSLIMIYFMVRSLQNGRRN